MKIKRIILAAFIVLLFASPLFAATPGTITGTLERMAVRQESPPILEVNTLSGISDYILKGLKLYSIKVFPSGVTAPTSGTSVTITDSRGLDLLGGKGSGLIPNTGNGWAAFGPSNYALPALITGNFTITISGNLVNSAGITVVLELTGD
jgi:hypothetical protein